LKLLVMICFWCCFRSVFRWKWWCWTWWWWWFKGWISLPFLCWRLWCCFSLLSHWWRTSSSS